MLLLEILFLVKNTIGRRWLNYFRYPERRKRVVGPVDDVEQNEGEGKAFPRQFVYASGLEFSVHFRRRWRNGWIAALCPSWTVWNCLMSELKTTNKERLDYGVAKVNATIAAGLVSALWTRNPF